MKKLISFCVVALTFVLSGKTQSSEKAKQDDFVAKYDNYIRQLMEKVPEIPGIAVAVIKGDQPLFIKAYGVADKEAGVKADANTLFYIASSTKSFTALAAALLDKEGLIQLNDPIIKYSKGIIFKNSIPERIKVQDLLTHTSGLQNDALAFRVAYSGESNKDDMAKVFAEATTFVESNYGKYEYDNLGYNIYAVLLQQNFNKNWKDVLQEKIFAPLKMKHTTAYISLAAANKWTVAAPYIFTGEKGAIRSWLEKTDENLQSAGGLFSSITDIGTWLNVNMNNGKLNGKQIFPESIIQKCQTGYTKTVRDVPPFIGNGEYGLGWQIGTYKNEKVIYHHGGFPGYTSHISFLPDQKIAVAVLINEGSVGGKTGHLLATYAYDWWLNTENVEAVYAQRLQELYDSYQKGKKAIQESSAERAKRKWQLSLPLENYTGTYQHPYFGTVKVFIKDDVLAAKMGKMECIATPYTGKETIQVELVPGSGNVIKFKTNADDKVEAIVYDSMEFVKIK